MYRSGQRRESMALSSHLAQNPSMRALTILLQLLTWPHFRIHKNATSLFRSIRGSAGSARWGIPWTDGTFSDFFCEGNAPSVPGLLSPVCPRPAVRFDSARGRRARRPSLHLAIPDYPCAGCKTRNVLPPCDHTSTSAS